MKCDVMVYLTIAELEAIVQFAKENHSWEDVVELSFYPGEVLVRVDPVQRGPREYLSSLLVDEEGSDEA